MQKKRGVYRNEGKRNGLREKVVFDMSGTDSRSSYSGRILLHMKIVLGIALVLAGILLVGTASAQNPALFNTVDAVGVLQTPLSPASDRIVVTVDFSLIHPEQNPVAALSAAIPGQTITLLKDKIEQRGTDNYTWSGKVEGREMSTAVLTVEDGFMYGHIDFAGESYSISPNSDGYIIVKNDPSQIPPYNDDVLIPPDRWGMAEVQPLGITPLADNGSVVDVLVLYTQQVQTKYGSGLNAKIQSFVDLANQAYINSGISTSLRLVHSALYTGASAAEGVAIGSALPYIRTDAAVTALRNTYYADLVSLLRVYQNTASCGLGYIFTPPLDSSFADYAVNVVEVKSLSECTGSGSCTYCSDLTFAHELGHNMGCAHDRAHASGQGAYPYSYGYDHVAAGISSPQFATVMSYVSPEITYFSTPSPPVPWLVPIGVSGGLSGNDNPSTSADNARTINNTRVTVANFRVGVAADTPPPADGTLVATPGNGQVSLSWSGFSDSGSGLRSTNAYRIVRSTGSYPSSQCMTGTQVYFGSGTSTADTGLTNGQTYYYRACAYDNAGNISTGATAVTTLSVNVTVASSPPGRQITVGGSPVTAPQTYVWFPGSSHTVNIASPQSGAAGTQYVFSAWSDGGAQSHSVNPVADSTYTASFATQYQLATSAPAASGSVSPNCSGTCWYGSGTTLGMTAVPANGYIFSSWSGDCAGTNLATTLPMNGPKTCTASFTACASPPAMIGATPYASIIDAYAAAAKNNIQNNIIKILGEQIAETLALDLNISVTLKGGYDCVYGSNPPSSSILMGAMTISRGSVIVTSVIASPSLTVTGSGSVNADNLILQ